MSQKFNPKTFSSNRALEKRKEFNQRKLQIFNQHDKDFMNSMPKPRKIGNMYPQNRLNQWVEHSSIDQESKAKKSDEYKDLLMSLVYNEKSAPNTHRNSMPNNNILTRLRNVVPLEKPLPLTFRQLDK
jgi:hypothetical protein